MTASERRRQTDRQTDRQTEAHTHTHTHARTHTHTHTHTLSLSLSLSLCVPQLQLMGEARQAIIDDRFPAFVLEFLHERHPDHDYPTWVREALASVNIHLPPQP